MRSYQKLERELRPAMSDEDKGRRAAKQAENARRHAADSRRHAAKVRAERCPCGPLTVAVYAEGSLARVERRHWKVRGCDRGTETVSVVDYGGRPSDEEV